MGVFQGDTRRLADWFYRVCWDIIPRMENQMEKSTQNGMATLSFPLKDRLAPLQ